MVATPEFAQRYRPVSFLGVEPYPFRSLIWVRTESEKIGAIHRRGTHEIPGYLLVPGGATERIVAALDGEGRLGMRLAGPGASLEAGFELAPGRWKYRVESTGNLDIRMHRSGADLARGESGTFTLNAPQAESVSLAIGGSGHVRRVVLERS
jgi:hypothetical protein